MWQKDIEKLKEEIINGRCSMQEKIEDKKNDKMIRQERTRKWKMTKSKKIIITKNCYKKSNKSEKKKKDILQEY